jgi:hypothetical protein
MATPLLTVSNAQRVENFQRLLVKVGASMCRANLTHLGDKFAASARELRGQTSDKHRFQRAGALASARAYYTLARRAAR